MLYTRNPTDAASCPTKSSLETPSFDPFRHCFTTCAITVRNNIIDAAHPTIALLISNTPCKPDAQRPVTPRHMVGRRFG